ncbi:methylated-DNA--[protein]-cysteine S-methyltransferase [Sphingomonas sp. 1P06PA]|uniref:methylated-DNA--[protein]-cysteine S-methyltransferase n=1 Tax=Sphingomonas sp. 1P06PA TaxID=554121 RepID=UPI0039A4E151
MHTSMPSLVFASPIGPITILRSGAVLARIIVGGRHTGDRPSDDPLLAEARSQLTRYFDDPAVPFQLPLAQAATPRGQQLREAMAAIGPGHTIAYGALARQTGSSARAIGQVCARNPFPIVIPCHRVLAAGGALGHYSAGDGIATKRWLLAHEGAERWDG